MIFEKRYLIEPSHFISVQYECDKCGSAIMVPIKTFGSKSVRKYCYDPCQHCSTVTGFSSDTAEMKAFLAFKTSLKEIAGAMEGRYLKLRLRIKCPE